MQKLLYIFLFVFASIAKQAVAQQNKIDSLLTLIKTDKEDTNKVKHLNRVGKEYVELGELDNGLPYAKASLALAQNLGYKKGISLAYHGLGVIYFSSSNYAEALKSNFSALKVRQELNDKKGIADSYNNIGLSYIEMGNYPEALKNHFAALKQREEIKDKYGITASYNNIGNIYSLQDNYPEALKNYFSALKTYKEINAEHP